MLVQLEVPWSRQGGRLRVKPDNGRLPVEIIGLSFDPLMTLPGVGVDETGTGLRYGVCFRACHCKYEGTCIHPKPLVCLLRWLCNLACKTAVCLVIREQ
jgi:hypothetical protein